MKSIDFFLSLNKFLEVNHRPVAFKVLQYCTSYPEDPIVCPRKRFYNYRITFISTSFVCTLALTVLSVVWSEIVVAWVKSVAPRAEQSDLAPLTWLEMSWWMDHSRESDGYDPPEGKKNEMLSHLLCNFTMAVPKLSLLHSKKWLSPGDKRFHPSIERGREGDQGLD